MEYPPGKQRALNKVIETASFKKVIKALIKGNIIAIQAFDITII